MSKSTILIIIVLALFGMYSCSSYNGLAKTDQEVKASWAKVESQYQRRADLIPNLVNTVKGVAEFEKSTLSDVIQARANATSIKIDANDLSPEKVQQFQAAQSQLNGTLSRLMAVAENYPQLKANQNFSELQAELAGTENRITVARNDFNDVVKGFNQGLVTFPTNLLAGMFGFKEKGYFAADAGAQKAPTVSF